MSVPYQPTGVAAQQSDGNILITWTGSLGATGYEIYRGTDGVNFTLLDTLLLVNSYLDELPGIGTNYYYRVVATNASGSSVPSSIVNMVAALPSEMSLGELRLRCQETADRVNSNFVGTSECNAFIRLAMYELYDLLIGSYSDWFADRKVFINTNGTLQDYPLPDGVTNYFGDIYPSTSADGAPARAIYKLSGIDLGVNTSNNAWVTLKSYDFIQRNKYVYPNSTSTIYGVYNMRYRWMGQYLNLIPTPSGNQQLRVWYAPRLPALLQDTDLTTLGVSGWLRYAIARTAKYILNKEEGTDTSALDAEIGFLKKRIEEMASNRDQGDADTISETRSDPIYGGTGFAGGGGAQGGW